MTRLVLHTGRFRDMGYETALSGPEHTPSERADVERFLAELRRGTAEGGVGVVIKVFSAGRAVEETLGFLIGRPLTPEAASEVKAQLEALHGNALPELLATAGQAASVTEARAVLRRGLDEWATRLTPLLEFAQTPQTGSHRSVRSALRKPRNSIPWMAAALSVVIVTFGAALWLRSFPLLTTAPPQASGPDACRPNGSEDDAEFASLLTSSQETMGRKFVRGDHFASLNTGSAGSLRLIVSEYPDDAEVCGKRRALANVYHHLSIIVASSHPERLERAHRALWEGADTRLLGALERLAALDLPASEDLCVETNRPCLPIFSEADDHIIDTLFAAYEMLALSFQNDAGVRESPLLDIAAFERWLASTTFRSGEISLRGELHRAGLGSDASSLLDPMKMLLDCPRPGECLAHAVRILGRAP